MIKSVFMALYKFAFALIILLYGFTSCSDGSRTGQPTANSLPEHPNILFIAIDDLRPELGCYGAEHIQSPNLDRLAAEGFLFNNHFVAVPTCGASRHALITGTYPRTTAHLSNRVIADSLAGKPETGRPESFIHHLRRNGYHTVGMGKISHMPDGFVYGYQEPVSDIREMPHSWDEFHFNADKWGTGHNAFFGYADGNNRNDLDKEVKPYEAADVSDEGYPDGLTAQLAIDKLGELAQKEEPFFMAVGFFKPHLPFTAPKKYWDLYDRDEIPLSPAPGIPDNVSLASLHGSGEFNQYALGEEKAGLDHDLSDEYARKLKHAYAACVSYIDAQVGKLLAELEAQGLAENTVVVVWGDHGWHLGDHRVWGKHTVFEWGLRSAFMLKLPGNVYAPRVFDEVVSTVDIYPTLVELAGVDMPHETDGSSLTALWDEDPATVWRNNAFGYFRRGISLRTPEYRLTRYFREEEPKVELYDHQSDPYEKENVAGERPEIVEELSGVWEEGNYKLFE